MDIYRVDKIEGGFVKISDFFKPGTICSEFDNDKEGFFEEGDVIYYSKEDEEFLFVNNADAQLGWLIIKQLTQNGEVKYADMSKESREKYDEAVKMIDLCYKEPKLFDKATSYDFAAERAAKLKLLEGE